MHCVVAVILIGCSDRRPETKQGIEGKIVRFRSERVRDRVRVRDKDCRSEPNTVHLHYVVLQLSP